MNRVYETSSIPDSFAHNTAGGNGGGLAVNSGTDVGVVDSSFDQNSAASFGGGMYFKRNFPGAALHVSVTRDTFSGNQASGASDVLGGGMYVSASTSGDSLTQTKNLFAGNSVATTTAAAARQGGGEWVNVSQFVSTGDSWTRNTAAPTSGAGSLEGAGLWLGGQCNPGNHQTIRNGVVAGNSSAGAIDGAGIYVGCITSPVALELDDTTVSGNSSGGAGTGGLWGGASDTLVLHNSIVAGNVGSDLTGFSSLTTTYSDACTGLLPPAGAGNICALPKLVDAVNGDVHETAASPTIDAGNAADVPAGISTDFYGALRSMGARVDMGAAEAFPVPPMPPLPPVFDMAPIFGPARAAQAVISHLRVRVRAGQPVSCPVGPSNCTVQVDMYAVISHRRVLVGRGTRAFAGATSTDLSVLLSRAATRKLNRVGVLRITFMITISRAHSAPQTRRVTKRVSRPR